MWVCRWKAPLKAAAFKQWLGQAAWQRDMRGRLRKALGRMRHVAVAAAFRGWVLETARAKTEGSTGRHHELQVRNASPKPWHMFSCTAPSVRPVAAMFNLDGNEEGATKQGLCSRADRTGAIFMQPAPLESEQA